MKKLIIPTLFSLCFIAALQASPLEDLIVSGNTLWSQGKLLEAETAFKKALEIDPDSSVAHARMANLYLTQNKTPEAVAEFQNAITADPENANLFIGLSIAYLHQQYYQMADAMANQAFQLNPELASVKKLKQYIDAKTDRMKQMPQTATVSTAEGGMHGQPSPHDQLSPQGQSNNSLPATIQKNIQKAH